MKSLELKLLQVRIHPNLHQEIKEHAKIHGRSVSSEANIMLLEAMAARNNTVFEFAKPKPKEQP